jgi:hypothetical protein
VEEDLREGVEPAVDHRVEIAAVAQGTAGVETGEVEALAVRTTPLSKHYSKRFLFNFRH